MGRAFDLPYSVEPLGREDRHVEELIDGDYRGARAAFDEVIRAVQVGS
jgi:hypothetical protein